jgi:c-di-GMP-binding flagellar brake protein YcgR
MTWQKMMNNNITDNQIVAKMLSKMSEKQIEEWLNNVDKLERVLYMPPTVNEIIEALKKDTKIETWYYDEDLKVFWSSQENECKKLGKNIKLLTWKTKQDL